MALVSLWGMCLEGVQVGVAMLVGVMGRFPSTRYMSPWPLLGAKIVVGYNVWHWSGLLPSQTIAHLWCENGFRGVGPPMRLL